MPHLPPLISDLALILSAAAMVTLLFRKLKQPLVLGYIAAGFLVGPHVSIFPNVTDVANIQTWAEIGVVFLLFSLGLEFSFKKLAAVGSSAAITGILEVSCMAFLGFFAGQWLGWSNTDSFFLGAILSISSTAIIIRAFDEAGVRGRGFVNLVFGILIVEDLIAVLLLVLLTTLAASQTVAGGDLLWVVGKLVFFLVFWFIAGVSFLPTALGRLKAHLTNETLLVVSLGLCFMMVILTSSAGFSPALGAFFMGSILSETSEGKRIEHLTAPIKNLFAAIFFVSVGMLINPQIIAQYSGPIFIFTFVILFGKVFFVSIGALLSGRSLRHAIQSGLSLAQIGEFSFIIATLGTTLKATSDFLYPIAIGVSALTTFTTPYMIQSADRIFSWIDLRLPQTWKQRLNNYSSAYHNTSFSSEWWKLVKIYALRVFMNAVIVSGIFFGVSHFFSPFLLRQIENEAATNALGLAVSLFLSAPFFWAMIVSYGKADRASALLFSKNTKKASVFAFEVSRWLIVILLLAILSTQFLTWKLAIVVFLVGGVLMVFVFSNHLEGVYRKIEGRFVKNLSAGADSATHMPPLAPWDAHLVSLEIDPSSEVLGQSLEKLCIRERFGITIALIERGTRKISAPSRGELLFPYDKVYVIGTDDQILHFRKHIEKNPNKSSESSEEFNYVLTSHVVLEQSHFCKRSIRDSGIREKSKGLIVGIERNGKRILNPDSTTIIEAGDVLWVVGERSALKQI